MATRAARRHIKGLFSASTSDSGPRRDPAKLATGLSSTSSRGHTLDASRLCASSFRVRAPHGGWR
eukprot:5593388-Pyramimonas_sp.AAC.1